MSFLGKISKKVVNFMSNKHLLIVLAFTLAILGGVCTGMFTADRAEPQETAAAEETKSPDEVPQTFVTPEPVSQTALSDEKYLVTVSDSYLFIYEISADNSMQIVEEKKIDSNSLRRDDYETLFKGITVDTLTEARELAEDYVS